MYTKLDGVYSPQHDLFTFPRPHKAEHYKIMLACWVIMTLLGAVALLTS